MNDRLLFKLTVFNTLVVAFAFFIAMFGDYYTMPRVIFHNSSMGAVFSIVETQSQANALFQLVKNVPAILLIFSVMGFGSIFIAERAILPIKFSWRRQQEFVADASHELRAPLASIQSNLEVVRDNPYLAVESLTKWLENIDMEVKRMTSMVSSLLLLAKIDSKQEMLQQTTFMLNKAVFSVLKPFEPEVKKKGMTLIQSFDGNVPYYGDEAKMKQLVVILMDNALKYTHSGGTISVAVNSFGKRVQISVADTGIGISEKHLMRIFERFYRVDTFRSGASGGTGLGLSIAEWIVKAHGGTINVVSIPGKGTTFNIDLPHNK